MIHKQMVGPRTKDDNRGVMAQPLDILLGLDLNRLEQGVIGGILSGHVSKNQYPGHHTSPGRRTCPQPNMKSCQTRMPSSKAGCRQQGHTSEIAGRPHRRRAHRNRLARRCRRPTRGPCSGSHRRAAAASRDTARASSWGTSAAMSAEHAASDKDSRGQKRVGGDPVRAAAEDSDAIDLEEERAAGLVDELVLDDLDADSISFSRMPRSPSIFSPL